MRSIDIFNGDADGICALLQLRLARPKDSLLITGIKRDIKLLERVEVNPGDELTVLDISLEKNQTGLERVLEQGASVFYVDHHRSGSIPEHPALQTIIDTDPNTCTSLLVDHYLKGKYRAWAVTAAFGDNMIQSAEGAAKALSISPDQLASLKILGTCLNYNGYGSCIEDLHFPPDQLYRELAPFESPFEFMAEKSAIYQQLKAGYFDDLANAENIKPEHATDSIVIYLLPDEVWSRRISGVYANQLANEYPDRAHAILSHNRTDGYLVSVRAPLNNKIGADELCSEFPTGGGRKGAAGINHLPIEDMSKFIGRMAAKYRD